MRPLVRLSTQDGLHHAFEDQTGQDAWTTVCGKTMPADQIAPATEPVPSATDMACLLALGTSVHAHLEGVYGHTSATDEDKDE